MVECPKIVDTVLMSHLFSTNRVANVWRNPWNVIGGIFRFERMRRKVSFMFRLFDPLLVLPTT